MVGVGLIAITIMFGVTLRKFHDAKDAVAVMGPMTGVVGTVVTAFFGIHATASTGTDPTQKVAAAGSDAAVRVAAAHNKAITAAAYAESGKASELLDNPGIAH